MTITVDKARWYEDSEGFWLAVRTKDRAAAASVTPKVTDEWEVTLGRHKKRRSLDANAYFWVLAGKLGESSAHLPKMSTDSISGT